MNLSINILLLSIFLFFRYVRANHGILLCLISLICLIASALFSKNNTNILFFIIIVAFFIFEIFVAILKERHHSIILKIQTGYKPLETIYHYIIFGLVIFIWNYYWQSLG